MERLRLNFVNWMLFGSNVLRRGELARALEILGIAHRYLEWMARLADDRMTSPELTDALCDGIGALTPHQRSVLIALALNGVPIDVLAERRNTTRGALYKTLHDARRKLRARLAEEGLEPHRVTIGT